MSLVAYGFGLRPFGAGDVIFFTTGLTVDITDDVLLAVITEDVIVAAIVEDVILANIVEDVV